MHQMLILIRKEKKGLMIMHKMHKIFFYQSKLLLWKYKFLFLCSCSCKVFLMKIILIFQIRTKKTPVSRKQSGLKPEATLEEQIVRTNPVSLIAFPSKINCPMIKKNRKKRFFRCSKHLGTQKQFATITHRVSENTFECISTMLDELPAETLSIICLRSELPINNLKAN